MPMSKKSLELRTDIKQERATETAETIIEAALVLVAERGLAGASPTNIAKRSGFSIGTIYRYFSNKSAIFNAAFEFVTDRQHAGMLEKISEFPSSATSRQFAMCLSEHYLNILHRRNPKYVIPVVRSYIRQSSAPEQFFRHIDVLVNPTLDLIKKNTSATFDDFDQKRLKLCFRSIATLLSTSFYEEEIYYKEYEHTQYILDLITRLLSKPH